MKHTTCWPKRTKEWCLNEHAALHVGDPYYDLTG